MVHNDKANTTEANVMTISDRIKTLIVCVWYVFTLLKAVIFQETITTSHTSEAITHA